MEAKRRAKRTKIELLAPAGDMARLKAAVEYGADAVYFAGKRFGARAFAGNFTPEEIEEGIAYAHMYGARAYVTVNTLLKNSEIKEGFDFISKIYSMGADAVIIQDFALARIIKDNFPDMQVHASTQAGMMNSDTINQADQFDRIILPRELSKEQIANIIKETGRPVEVFVHGALCFSFSGQCLMSSMIGGRSGNRGMCAQPCRKKYNVYAEKEPYLLSTADLCLIKRLPEIIEMGISSVKIEGRMKPIDYVRTTVSMYRKKIDGYYEGSFRVSEEDILILKKGFNRTFTEGFFSGTRKITAPAIPTNRQRGLKASYRPQKIRIPENITISIRQGKKLSASIQGKKIDAISHYIIQRPKNQKTSVQTIRSELLKSFAEVAVESEGEFFIPHSVMTSFRNDLMIRLAQKQKEISHRTTKTVKIEDNKEMTDWEGNPQIIVKVFTPEDVQKAEVGKADIICYDLFAADIEAARKSTRQSKFYAHVPRIIFDEQATRARVIIRKLEPDGLLLGNPALLDMKKELPVILDYSFNLFNDLDLDYWDLSGIVSPELNLEELARFYDKQKMICYIHGRVVMMSVRQILEHEKLTDEKKHTFPVRKTGTGYTEILNSVETGLFQDMLRLKGRGIMRYYLELSDSIEDIIKIYRDLISGKVVPSPRGYTKGHMDRGIL